MKKLLCTLLVCAFAFAGCLLGVSGISARAEGETAECAVSDFTELPEEQGEFDGLPSDWQLYEECAVDRTNVSCENGNLTVSHDADHGVSAAQYYGAVYLLGTDKIYSDFALEMTVKAKSYFDAALVRRDVSHAYGWYEFSGLYDELPLCGRERFVCSGCVARI